MRTAGYRKTHGGGPRLPPMICLHISQQGSLFDSGMGFKHPATSYWLLNGGEGRTRGGPASYVMLHLRSKQEPVRFERSGSLFFFGKNDLWRWSAPARYVNSVFESRGAMGHGLIAWKSFCRLQVLEISQVPSDLSMAERRRWKTRSDGSHLRPVQLGPNGQAGSPFDSGMGRQIKEGILCLGRSSSSSSTGKVTGNFSQQAVFTGGVMGRTCTPLETVTPSAASWVNTGTGSPTSGLALNYRCKRGGDDVTNYKFLPPPFGLAEVTPSENRNQDTRMARPFSTFAEFKLTSGGDKGVDLRYTGRLTK
ncbi:hypothetical protein C8R47DRAFT_1270730 [Mycena vitilis]|nr:hypothetical protein C8R47DRAFT_1270730 [Mycena vitilis]